MTMIMTSSLVAFMIPILVFVAAWVLSMRTNIDREKSSPFECGFDPNHSARVPFSMRFFLLAIIFIVFDIEIVLLIPIPILMNLTNLTSMLISASSFLSILIIGLIHEWNQGSLDWYN